MTKITIFLMASTTSNVKSVKTKFRRHGINIDEVIRFQKVTFCVFWLHFIFLVAVFLCYFLPNFPTFLSFIASIGIDLQPVYCIKVRAGLLKKIN